VIIDDIGAIFMAGSHSSRVHMRHIDTQYQFIREYVVDGFIKIIFARTSEYDEDIFSKNVKKESI
jgi:hypothetical protein